MSTFSRTAVVIVAVVDMPGRSLSRTSGVGFSLIFTRKSLASCEPDDCEIVWPDRVMAEAPFSMTSPSISMSPKASTFILPSRQASHRLCPSHQL